MKHEVGLFCGRFQPIHRGHTNIIAEAMKQCDTLVIAIGSAQESGTKKNPFSFEFRKELIMRSISFVTCKVIIIGVNDRAEVKDDAGWGQYLLNEVYKQTGLRPTINFSGAEEIRSHWFDGVEMEQVAINRQETPISSTMVRQRLLDDNYLEFCYITPAMIWMKYEKMRNIVKEIYDEKVQN